MMELWTNNEEDLKVETRDTGTGLKKSGVYKCEIIDAQIIKAKDTESTALQLIFKNEDQETFRVRHFFKNKLGEEVKFVRETLNKLTYLCKIKPKDIVIVEMPDKNLLPAYVGANIGVVVEVKENGDYLNYEIKAYFDIKSEKTADEIVNKKNAEIIERFKERYKNVAPIEKEKTQEKNEDLPEEFPF